MAVFGPKVRGMACLEKAHGSQPVQHMVVFSSVAALLGSGGQANYVAANSGLDAWAETRHVQGTVGLQPPVVQRKRHRILVQEPEDAMARLAPPPRGSDNSH